MPNNTIGWGQAAANNSNGFGAAAQNNNINWGWIHSRSYGHDETDLVGATAPVLSVDGETITIERAAPAPAPSLSLTPPVTIVIN